MGEFCENEINQCEMHKYNLIFDNRFKLLHKQKHNGIQVRLINFDNKYNIETFKQMDIHLDLVCSIVTSIVWIDYNIDFNSLREIKYLNITPLNI